jgi:Ca2+-transporting ATPase
MLIAGDKVPADIRIFEYKNLYAAEAVLTGESVPVAKNSQKVSTSAPLGDRTCIAYSGTYITAGQGKGVVYATGNSTEIGKISSLMQQEEKLTTPLMQKLADFGKYLSIYIVVVCILAFFLGLFRGIQWSDMFIAAVAMAVAAIPEGLPAVVTIILAIGVQRMAKRNAIIRKLPAVETLGSVSVICTDKTGTLTKNEMTVKKIATPRYVFEVEGSGFAPGNHKIVDSNGNAVNSKNIAELEELLISGVCCNDSFLNSENGFYKVDGDPTEGSLLVSAIKGGLNLDDLENVYKRADVLPFDSANQLMATVNHHNGNHVMYVKGAVEKVLARVKDENLSELGIDKQKIISQAESMAKEGLRVLAFGRKSLEDKKSIDTIDDIDDLEYLGLQGMIDPVREQVPKAVEICHKAGIEVKMVTGDHLVTARAIGNTLNLENNVKALPGDVINNYDGEELYNVVKETSVFARVAPEHKHKLVKNLQEKGHIVAMTGDGVNDGPALKKANIGIAMGITGTEVAKEASDMILTDDNFASIVNAVEEGRIVFNNLVKSLIYLLPTNGGQALALLSALVFNFELPIQPLQILWVNIVTAVLLSMPLGFEPAEAGIMNKKPRKPEDPLINLPYLARMILVSILMVLGSVYIFYSEKEAGMSLEVARTSAVNTIVFIEIFFLLSMRSLDGWAIKAGIFKNLWIWGGILATVILQLAFTYLPISNLLFHTAPINLMTWVKVVSIGFVSFMIIELFKVIVNYFSANRQRRSTGAEGGSVSDRKK